MNKIIKSLLLILILPALGMCQDAFYDVIVKNGRVLDGSGNPWIKTDIAIDGNRIAAVGDLSEAGAEEIIDAGGLYVAPGFIDTHSHASSGLQDPDLSAARPQLAQGVTSVFINPDGGGSVDLEDQRDRLLVDKIGVNVAQFVPHGSVRREVMNMDDRAPEENELQEMKDLVRRGMEIGAFGLSSGPFYPPGSYSDTDELIALSKVASEYNGTYQSHIRDESDYNIGLVASVDEVIEIADKAGLPGIVTHIKALGPNVWGYSAAVVHRIERAREQGIEVMADQYPYNASATGLSAALVPSWARAGGTDEFRNRLDDEAKRDSIYQGMVENLARRGGAHRLTIRRFREDPSLEGMTLEEIAQNRELPAVDTALELLKEGSPGVVSFNMHDRDVHRFMSQPWTMTSSDGGLVEKGEGVPHPRNYGAFSRKIREFVVEQEVVDLASAVRSMTHMPASVYGVEDRGLIREGNYADIVVFDLDEVNDPATFTEPHQLSEGMIHVFVNGVPAISDESFTGERPGTILSRQ